MSKPAPVNIEFSDGKFFKGLVISGPFSGTEPLRTNWYSAFANVITRVVQAIFDMQGFGNDVDSSAVVKQVSAQLVSSYRSNIANGVRFVSIPFDDFKGPIRRAAVRFRNIPDTAPDEESHSPRAGVIYHVSTAREKTREKAPARPAYHRKGLAERWAQKSAIGWIPEVGPGETTTWLTLDGFRQGGYVWRESKPREYELFVLKGGQREFFNVVFSNQDAQTALVQKIRGG